MKSEVEQIKLCPRCETASRMVDSSGRVQSYCKECMIEYARERYRKITKSNISEESMQNILDDRKRRLEDIIMLGRRKEGYGDTSFSGATHIQLFARVIDEYDLKDEIILIPMAGSGTELDYCKQNKIKNFAFDIDPQRPDIEYHDATFKFPRRVCDVGAAWADPPFPGDKSYGKDSLGYNGSEEYVRQMDLVMLRIHETLKPDGYFFLYIKDQKNFDGIVPVVSDLIHRATVPGMYYLLDKRNVRVSTTPQYWMVDKYDESYVSLPLMRQLLVFKKQ